VKSDGVKPNEQWESTRLDETHQTMLDEIDRLKEELDRRREADERRDAIERAATAFVLTVEAGGDADPNYEALGHALGIALRPSRRLPEFDPVVVPNLGAALGPIVPTIEVLSLPMMPVDQVALVQPGSTVALFSIADGSAQKLAEITVGCVPVPPRRTNKVFASTGAEPCADGVNVTVGVTAHCACGNVFTDDVVAGVRRDVIAPEDEDVGPAEGERARLPGEMGRGD